MPRQVGLVRVRHREGSGLASCTFGELMKVGRVRLVNVRVRVIYEDFLYSQSFAAISYGGLSTLTR